MARNDQAAIEELAQLLDGELPADEAPAELAQLLQLASSVSEHTEVARPTPAFRASLRRELVEEIEASQVTLFDRMRDTIRERTAGIRHSVRAGLATGVASAMIGSAGVAVAAQQAIPGDVLYPVKQATEDVRMWLTGGQVEAGRLHLQFARERLEEIEDGAGRLDGDQVIDTLGDMDDETIAGADDLLRVFEDTGATEVLDELTTFTTEQTSRLTVVMDRLPAIAVPVAEDSLEVLRRVDVQVSMALDPCIEICGNTTTTTPPDRPTVVEPGEGPAVPADSCECTSGPVAEPPRDPGQTQDDTAASEDPGPADDGTTDDTAEAPDDGGTDVVPPLPGDLDEVGDQIDEVIDDLVGDDGTVDDVTDQLPDEVGDQIDDAVDDLTGDDTSTDSGDVAP